ncbi:MAG: class I SAM-dependent methyltransferase [Winogradskyella sp.]|uniref:class I SAM-dependent methyltransferase n=1 Tax=Winogradskyella sp. TaxID=1883156 RepID=UPI00385A1CCC
MKHITKLLIILSLVALPTGSFGQDTSKDEKYTFKKGDPNGIGKWYMGREIAHVMGFQGMSWLERPELEAEENTSKLIKNMNIQPEDTIADIGAGSGYHVFKMAKIANQGFVFAVDIQEEMLEAITENSDDESRKNISTVLGTEKTVNLPENSVDKILMVDVYHEFNYPYEMLLSIKEALREDGEIYLIEYRAEDATVPIKKVHKMSESQAVKEMKAVGFKLKENISNLPWQHCMVFIRE